MRISALMRAMLVLALVKIIPARGADNQWIGTSSQLWDDAANWTLGVPTTGQSVLLTDALSPTFTTAVFKSATDPSLTSLTVDGSAANSMTLGLVTNTSFDVLTAGNTAIGLNGTGALVQSGGTLTASQLVLGQNVGSTGSYSQNGGVLLATDDIVGGAGTGTKTTNAGTDTVKNDLVLGDQAKGNGTYNLGGTGALTVMGTTQVGNAGTGNFNQSGGTHKTNALTLANATGSTGTYALTSGTLEVATDTTVGGNGKGQFTHSAGTHTVGGDLLIGAALGVTGKYELSNTGELKVTGSTVVGASGTGEFIQSDGTHNTGNLTVGLQGTGTYTLSKGTLTTGNSTVGFQGTGTFNQSGGTHNAGSLTLGSALGSTGEYKLTSGEINVNGGTTIGASGNGAFVQDGGTHAVGADLVLGMNNGSTGKYELNDGMLTVGNDVLIGSSGRGEFVQSGGTHQVTNMLILGEKAGSFGSYSLSGGTLTVTLGDTLVGDSGNGQFEQSGGTHTTGVLSLGSNAGTTGTYDLSLGTLSTTCLRCATIVGDGGTGEFTQTGGDHNTQALTVGNETGSDGRYDLSKGNVTVTGSTTVGAQGTGQFTQSGGMHTTGALVIGAQAGGDGTYTQTAGTLFVTNRTTIGAGGFDIGIPLGSPTRGVGVFTQSGGMVTTDQLVLGTTPLDAADPNKGGGMGTYMLSGGTLMVNGGTYVGDKGAMVGAATIEGIGVFKLNGGTHSANTLVIGSESFSNGTYELSSGTLTIGNATIVGSQGKGTVSQSGGAATTKLLILGSNAGSTGSYTLTGGDLTVTDKEQIGPTGTGMFTQSGGMHRVTNTLAIGGKGTLDMSDGTLKAGSIVNDGTLNYTGGTLIANITNNKTFNVKPAGAGAKVVMGNVVNSATGTIKVTGTKITWKGTFNNKGAYNSDPSENFFSDLSVDITGYLTGGVGDLFSISGDFFNQSEQNSLWQTDLAELTFAGSGPHHFDFNALDLGDSSSGYLNNFAWGELSIDPGVELDVFDGNTSTPGAALYTRLFDIVGQDLSELLFIHSDYNIYYDPTLAGNSYLQGENYQLNGAGCLIAIGNDSPCLIVHVPEPNTWKLIAVALGGLWCVRRRLPLTRNGAALEVR